MKGIGMKNFSGYTVAAAMLAAATLAGCPPREELHTQVIDDASDIDGKQLYFIPAVTDDLKRLGDPYYTRIVSDLEVPGQLPNPTAGAQVIEFPEGGGSVEVALDEPVMYYGVFYDTLVIGSNGTVAFGAASQGNDSLENHFKSTQISVLPIDASLVGTEVTVEQDGDAVTVTFDNVIIGTETDFTTDNTFQVEIFVSNGIAGDIVLSYVKVDERGNGVVGFANGQLAGKTPEEINQFLRRFQDSNLAVSANTTTVR